MRRLSAVLLVIVGATITSCGQQTDMGPLKSVGSLREMNAALKDIGVCPTDFDHVDTPYITLSGEGGSKASASFGCEGKAIGADGFRSAEDRDQTANDPLRMVAGPYLVGTDDNLWILSYDDGNKREAGKILKRLENEARVVTS